MYKDIYFVIPSYGMESYEFLQRRAVDDIDFKLIEKLNKKGPIYYEVRDVLL